MTEVANKQVNHGLREDVGDQTTLILCYTFSRNEAFFSSCHHEASHDT